MGRRARRSQSVDLTRRPGRWRRRRLVQSRQRHGNPTVAAGTRLAFGGHMNVVIVKLVDLPQPEVKLTPTHLGDSCCQPGGEPALQLVPVRTTSRFCRACANTSAISRCPRTSQQMECVNASFRDHCHRRLHHTQPGEVRRRWMGQILCDARTASSFRARAPHPDGSRRFSGRLIGVECSDCSIVARADFDPAAVAMSLSNSSHTQFSHLRTLEECDIAQALAELEYGRFLSGRLA